MGVKIGTKLTSIFLILCILPTLILGIYSYGQVFESLETREIEKLELLMDNIVNTNRLTVTDTEFLLKNLSSTHSFISLLEEYHLQNSNIDEKHSLEANETLRKIFVDSMGYYESIFIVASDGNIIADSLGKAGQSLGINNYDFIHKSIKESKFIMSPIYLSKLGQTGVQTSTISMSYPIKQGNGKILGAIVITVNFRNFNKAINNVEVGKTGYGYMMNREGVVLNHNDSGMLLKVAEDEISTKVVEELKDTSINHGYGHVKYGGDTWTYFYNVIPNTNNWVVVFALPENEYLDTATQIQMNTLRIIGFSIVIAMILAIVYVKHFTKNIYEMVNVMKKISKGDFTIYSQCKSKDEFGELSMSINEMVDSQQKVLHEMAVTSNNLDVVGSKLVKATENGEKYMDEITSTAQQFLTTAEENEKVIIYIEESIKNVALQANKVEEVSIIAVEESNKTHKAIIEGMNTTNKALDTMVNIDTAIEETARDVHSLVEASEKINGFIDYIRQVSKQTNLLALNAAIESARVGENGEGFAVVAEEVRKLSDQSDGAAQSMSKVINEIVQEIFTVKEKIEIAKQQSLYGKEASEEVKNIFYSILNSVEEVAQMIANTRNAANEQTIATKQVQQYMEQIGKMIEYTVEGAKEIAVGTYKQSTTMGNIDDIAKGLSNTSNQLSNIVSKFKTVNTNIT